MYKPSLNPPLPEALNTGQLHGPFFGLASDLQIIVTSFELSSVYMSNCITANDGTNNDSGISLPSSPAGIGVFVFTHNRETSSVPTGGLPNNGIVVALSSPHPNSEAPTFAFQCRSGSRTDRSVR